MDLCGFHDADYLSIDERIRQAFAEIDCSRTVPIATGYTKGTEGIMREFDRGYSEVTFSKIAVAVDAAEAVIHKEYHLSSADPAIVGVEQSRPVGATNFNVADQLAALLSQEAEQIRKECVHSRLEFFRRPAFLQGERSSPSKGRGLRVPAGRVRVLIMGHRIASIRASRLVRFSAETATTRACPFRSSTLLEIRSTPASSISSILLMATMSAAPIASRTGPST